MKLKFALLCFLALPAALLAATFRVNNAPGTSPDHTTIQAAINAASDGDTILVEGSSTAYASFLISNKRLNLIGPGYNLAGNLGTPANKLGAIVSGATSYVRTTTSSAGSSDGSLVMGLEFGSELRLDGCANVTIARCAFNIQSSSGRIYIDGPNNLISQCLLRGSGVLSWGSINNPTGNRIENSIIPDSGISISGTGILVYFRNNVLYGLSASSVILQVDNNIFLSSTVPTSNATYRNNIFSSSLNPNLVGTGNLGGVVLPNVMPSYSNSSASTDGRYQLSTGVSPLPANPALNAGTDGTHIGPFGGPNPYILSGIPPLPTIDEISVPQFAAPGTSLTIRVKVGARP